MYIYNEKNDNSFPRWECKREYRASTRIIISFINIMVKFQRKTKMPTK